MDTYHTNLASLKIHHPALASLVQNRGEDARVSLQDTPSGAPTLLVQTPGKTYALHHPEDPPGHARRMLEFRPEWQKARNIAVLGCGMGYLPILLHRDQPKLQHLFILEPSLSVFRQALRGKIIDARERFIDEEESSWIATATGTLRNWVYDLFGRLTLSERDRRFLTAIFNKGLKNKPN